METGVIDKERPSATCRALRSTFISILRVLAL